MIQLLNPHGPLLLHSAASVSFRLPNNLTVLLLVDVLAIVVECIAATMLLLPCLVP